jgi:hypothetical protein
MRKERRGKRRRRKRNEKEKEKEKEKRKEKRNEKMSYEMIPVSPALSEMLPVLPLSYFVRWRWQSHYRMGLTHP